MLQIICGILMKQASKQEDNQEQGFWQNEVHNMSTTLYQNLENGWLLTVLLMLQEHHY